MFNIFKIFHYFYSILKYKKKLVYGVDIPVEINIGKDDLVLDVGGGSNPIIRADIVAEKHIGYKGNPVFLNDYIYLKVNSDQLPFIDKKFDWVICRHTLEHVRNASKFLEEINRISKNFLIITPSPLREYNGHDFDHFWLVYVADGKLFLEAIPPFFKYKEIRKYEQKHIKEIDEKNEDKVEKETVYIKKYGDKFKYEIIGTIDAGRATKVEEIIKKNELSEWRKKPNFTRNIKHKKLHKIIVRDIKSIEHNYEK